MSKLLIMHNCTQSRIKFTEHTDPITQSRNNEKTDK